MRGVTHYTVEWTKPNGKLWTKTFVGERADKEALAYARKNTPRKPTIVKHTSEIIVSWESDYERHANGLSLRPLG